MIFHIIIDQSDSPSNSDIFLTELREKLAAELQVDPAEFKTEEA